MTIDHDELRAIAEAAPCGKWEVWTSNSWRRIYARNCGETSIVIEPCVQRSDNHPDLTFGPGVVQYIEACTPSTILALLDEIDALRHLEATIRRDRAVFEGTGDEFNPTGFDVTEALARIEALARAAKDGA